MTALQIIFGAVLILSSILIVILVLMQQSRQAGLSGAIAGGAETFFDKHKGRSIEAKLERITKWVAVFFFIFSLAVSLILYFVK
ncbi:MAG: preprotein translocase subunit SecG [Clostridiales bacterium]|nr:preprotein translocase subunit SecG [Clostridiales bacterium]